VSNAIENIGYVATIWFMSEPRLYVPGGKHWHFLNSSTALQ